jgi:hypothetical protein
MSRNKWPFVLLIVIVAVAAWVAYTRYFTHSGPLPNFHW